MIMKDYYYSKRIQNVACVSHLLNTTVFLHIIINKIKIFFFLYEKQILFINPQESFIKYDHNELIIAIN